PDPWINRPMRAQIGLPQPEQRIGYAAHDFSQLAAAPKVYMTRAAKVDGVPTVPSRWILRLEAVLKGFGKENNIRPDAARGDGWLQWAETRDAIQTHNPVRAPRPAPPVEMRPRKMSVTRIENWLANPYSVFARAILRLTPLDPLERLPDMATRGRIIHQALHLFTVRHPDALPVNAAEELMAAADEILDAYAAHPRVAAFWRPRLRRFAEWFAETEPARRGHTKRIITEVGGERELEGPAGPFILTARADRIDIGKDDRVLIYDYKSGTAPSEANVIRGVSPQLPLEAAIVHAGGFENIPNSNVEALSYISASGGEPPGEERRIKKTAPDDLADTAIRELAKLIADYDRPETDYRAIRRAAFANAYRYDDYAHLARVQEWSLGDGDDG
ncbi:MAG: PD-(D/E)XK nuclease family protein, partial [Hyphomicrobiaceae bacterium]